MINLGYFFSKFQDVKLKDILAGFPMLLAIVLIPFKRRKYANTWLIGEIDNEARDNGYHFYKYMQTNHPEQPCIYFISKTAKDYSKVASLGPTVKTGSIRHWLLYFTCRWTISSQKGGKPNSALCSFLELNNLIKPRFVFLQHGVTKDRNSWLLADRCRFIYLITATTSEYKFVSEAFGYPRGVVQLTGFPRFDNLHNNKVVQNRVIIMPTWRIWLRNKSSKGVTGEKDLSQSKFMKYWLELLNSTELEEIAHKWNLEVLFFPHRLLQPYLDEFKISNPVIQVVSDEQTDIQDVLKSAAVMITDWSSVYFDMFYMKKPVIFYQFDEDDFRKYHYEAGWFDYHRNNFGKSFADAKGVLSALESLAKKEFQVDESFLSAHKKEFQLYDNKNSERIYTLLTHGNALEG